MHHRLEGLLRRGCNGHVVAFLHHAETPVIEMPAAAAIPDDNQNACSFALHFLLHGSAADMVKPARDGPGRSTYYRPNRIKIKRGVPLVLGFTAA